ncbi:MAG: hypothetical protein HDR00_02890 [Lachnospiraceae bacterium]|nr:hypothetical protein [Lachnospiraceae bacterium]
MDFLSKVSAKAGETFQTIKESEVTKKAKNYAGIPGLQVQIGKCESKIRKAYEKIGEEYYKAHENEQIDEYEEEFSCIKENLEKIGQLKAEIEEKKSGGEAVADVEPGASEKICPICNRSVAEDAAFCSVCGHQF